MGGLSSEGSQGVPGGGPGGHFGVLFVVPVFCFFEFRGDICVEIERGVFSVFQNIDDFIDFMCKSEIRVLSRFCFFLGPEY